MTQLEVSARVSTETIYNGYEICERKSVAQHPSKHASLASNQSHSCTLHWDPIENVSINIPIAKLDAAVLVLTSHRQINNKAQGRGNLQQQRKAD